MIAVVGLALLAVPRVVLHDLGVLTPGTALNLVLVVAPPFVWVATALLAGVRRPFVTLLAIGVVHALLLALVHQLLWGAAFAGAAPRLGGRLAGLDPLVQELVLRSAAIVSSLVTGIVLGAVLGLLAEVLARVARGGRGRAQRRSVSTR
ncbi:hypothetical protein [Brachybacterium sp. SGAir0954]|uniref:hypothetical protein n=1 Tax=Brachybacterium sp. SGAir0954 TaxID=2571029 RepID=UPI001F0FB9B6|nr:hypothetical protein [Brachybacterium sp. SGAir0954]